jgi:hypothetical protein
VVSSTDLPLLLSAVATLAALAAGFRPRGAALAWLLFAFVRAADLHHWLGALLAGLPVALFEPLPPVPRPALLAGAGLAGLLPLAVACRSAARARGTDGSGFAAALAGLLAASLGLGGGLDLAGKLLPDLRSPLVAAELSLEAALDLAAAALLLAAAASAGCGAPLAAAAGPGHLGRPTANGAVAAEGRWMQSSAAG